MKFRVPKQRPPKSKFSIRRRQRRTLAELEAEIAILKDLEDRALRLKLSGQDAKWRRTQSILDEPIMLDPTTGLRRKILIFTEPKDTLEYLQQKIIGTTRRSLRRGRGDPWRHRARGATRRHRRLQQ